MLPCNVRRQLHSFLIFRKEIKQLKIEISDLQIELDQFYEKERLPSGRRTSRYVMSGTGISVVVKSKAIMAQPVNFTILLTYRYIPL